MPHIDLYSIYQLDRRQPPEALAAALTTQLNATDPRDALSRSRIDTARAILGDPHRRARYDAALADPKAPIIDESALAAIAGRPMPAPARTGLAGAFASRQVRVLSAITAALALVLVVGITAVACSGGGDSTPTAASNGSGQSTSTASGNSSCQPESNTKLNLAYWKASRSSTPSRVVVLRKKIDLPGQYPFDDKLTVGVSYAALGPDFQVGFRGLTQFRDKSIAAFQGPDIDNLQATSAHVTTISPEGSVLATNVYTIANRPPTGFDLAREGSSGYFRIAGANGVTVPAAAAGTEEGQAYAAQILPDAFEDSTVWVVMKGEGRAVYKATLYSASDASACTN